MTFEEDFPLLVGYMEGESIADFAYRYREHPNHENPMVIKADTVKRNIIFCCLDKSKVKEAIEKIAKKHSEHNEGIALIFACFCADLKKELKLE